MACTLRKTKYIFQLRQSFTFDFVVARIKIPYPLQWGAPTFDAGHAFGMMAAVLVSLIEVLSCHSYTKYLPCI